MDFGHFDISGKRTFCVRFVVISVFFFLFPIPCLDRQVWSFPLGVYGAISYRTRKFVEADEWW